MSNKSISKIQNPHESVGFVFLNIEIKIGVLVGELPKR